MSIASEYDEVKAILYRMLDNLIRDNQSGAAGAALRQQINSVRANFLYMMNTGVFAAELLECFTKAFDAGMKLPSLVPVHEQLFLEEPEGDIATALVESGTLYCMSTESLVITRIQFTSRDDVQALMAATKTAFDKARELAADASDSSTYQSLTALAGALTNHLATTARPLPRMVSFTMPRLYSALALSQRLYYTAERWEEIYAENKVVHPLFCPRQIRGLSG